MKSKARFWGQQIRGMETSYFQVPSSIILDLNIVRLNSGTLFIYIVRGVGGLRWLAITFNWEWTIHFGFNKIDLLQIKISNDGAQ